METQTLTGHKVLCYHCGDECLQGVVHFDLKNFCCEGCKLVFEILKENNLSSYYTYNKTPGTARKTRGAKEQFAYLDTPSVIQKLVHFSDGKITRITFSIPQIHCSSCIWLLENLGRIHPGVIQCIVNFPLREASITFDEKKITLRQLVEMLATIGYTPRIVLDDLGTRKQAHKNHSQIYKIGIAGFCFGNIMLFSFPEYFSSGTYHEQGFRGMFSYLNFALSLPVFFYCSSQFFVSAWQSTKQKFLNIDVPIALGILVMFIRSSYEIISGTGAGFMDTMSGLVFFMLAGRAFQEKTFRTISFDRDYKSFFPVSVMVRGTGNKETSIPVSDLKTGDVIIVRNEELIPADAVLRKGDATIDYSFVTGESAPVSRNNGDLIFAGGKQKGTVIELEIVKNVSQSYLTQLWNSSAYDQKHFASRFYQLVNQISHYFTMVLVAIALASLAWWGYQHDWQRGWNAFTAVLIIACPCALAISSPFTLGNILRIFGKNNFYLKNYAVIEKLARVDTIVFDKTGTLTKTNSSDLKFHGELGGTEKRMVKTLAYHSGHALGRLVCHLMGDAEPAAVKDFFEKAGSGISGKVFGVEVKIGLAAFAGIAPENQPDKTRIYVSIDNIIRGHFSVSNIYREGLNGLAPQLALAGYRLSVLSGDHEGERKNLENIFSQKAELLFNQVPGDKLRYIQRLQRAGKNVLMVGDGLNDSGALKQSDVGIAISDNVNNFSPACDGILKASQFSMLPGILKTAKVSRRIILASFLIALVYNIAGLSFAVNGNLSPVIAAVLMPLSAVTIIAFTTITSNLAANIYLRVVPRPGFPPENIC